MQSFSPPLFNVLSKDPVNIFRKILIQTKIAQQLTVKKKVKCKKCSVPNLSYTLIPAADDLASSNLELKRFCPVPGGVELLSICQGTCLAKTFSMRLHNLLLQRKTMRPVHVHTAGFWTDAQQHSFIHLKWRAETKNLIRNMKLNPLIGIITGQLFSADRQDIAGQRLAAICSVHSIMPQFHSLNTAGSQKQKSFTIFTLDTAGCRVNIDTIKLNSNSRLTE